MCYSLFKTLKTEVDQTEMVPAFGTFIERERGNVFIKKMILEVGKCSQENKTGNMIKGVGGGRYE